MNVFTSAFVVSAGLSKKAWLECEANVKAHAAIPKYIQTSEYFFAQFRDKKCSYVLAMRKLFHKLFSKL